MLNFNDVSIRRGGNLLFQQATFVVFRGVKLGVTGANGSGKSSLFSLIQGGLSVEEGQFGMPPDLVIAHVAQETPSVEKKAIDYVIDGDTSFRQTEQQLRLASHSENGFEQAKLHQKMEEIEGYSVQSRAAKLMSGLGFQPDQIHCLLPSLSGGWRMRLNLAQALMCRSDILLLDEPTNHLDLDAVIWLQDWLKEYSGTLLLISHDREFLDSITNHIAHIEHQSIKLYRGNYSAFEVFRAETLALQQATRAKQQREIQHIRSFVDRFRAKATKARQVQSRLNTLKKMELIAQAHADSPIRFSFQNPDKTPNPLLKLEKLSIGYGESTVLSGVNLILSPGDRIGLLGPNGAGKSTLIKLLAGEIQQQQGKLKIADDCSVGYFAQHQLEQLHGDESPLQHFQTLASGAVEKELRNFLGGFGFHGDEALEPVGLRSGGEKARLVLALLAFQRPNVLLLDEPTNHLDLYVRHALSVALQEYSGAMVIVSHDRHLLRTVTDQFYLVANGGVECFDGDLEDYRNLLNQSKGDSSLDSGSQQLLVSKKDRRRLQAERRLLLQPLHTACKQAELKLESLHTQQKKLDLALSDANLYELNNKEKLQELIEEKNQIEQSILKSEQIWFDACAKLEDEENRKGDIRGSES